MSVIPFSSNAQFRIFKNIDEVEIFAGPSFLTIRGSEDVSDGREPFVRLNAGVSLKHNFTNRTSLTGGIFYGKKGGRQIIETIYYDTISQSEKSGEVEYIVELEYLTIPITVRYNFLKKRILFVEVGPYLGILLKETTTVTRFYSGQRNSFEDTESYNKNDFGVTVGIGLSLPINTRISLSAKVNTDIGLIDVSKLDPNMSTHDIIKTNSTSLLLGLNFKLKPL